MPDNQLRTKFRNLVASAITEAVTAQDFEHPTLIGEARELLVEKMLRPALPPDIQFGSGKLVDASGQLSSQIDVIIYSPAILPTFTFDSRTGLYPYESCLYAIEVKSTLTKTEVEKTVKNALELRKLTSLPTHYWFGREHFMGPIPLPISALFAFKSDLVGTIDDELNRYRLSDKFDLSLSPALATMCIVGKGYAYFSKEKQCWVNYSPTSSFDEVLSFLAGVSNTIPELIARKGRPKYGNYLIDEPSAP